MSKVNILNQEWLDLVFEGRNKSYGAYQLRRQDSRTTLIALFSGIALVGILVSIPSIINLFKDETAVLERPEPSLPGIIEDKILVELQEKPKDTEAQTAGAAPITKENTRKFTTPEPTAGPAENEIPKTDDFTDANPGNHTAEGTGGIDIGQTSPTGTDDGTGTGNTDDTGEGSIETTATIDENPEFPGGLDAFKKAVISKFKVPEINETVTLKVYVSFVVEKDGTMTDIKVAGKPQHNLGEEALKALKAINKKWKPGYKKGKPVRTAYNLPIVVRIN